MIFHVVLETIESVAAQFHMFRSYEDKSVIANVKNHNVINVIIRAYPYPRFWSRTIYPIKSRAFPHNRKALTNGRSFSLCRRIVKAGLVRCWSKDDDFDGVCFQVRRRLKLSVDSWSLPRCCLAAASRSILHFYSTSVFSWILLRHGSFALHPCMAMLLYII